MSSKATATTKKFVIQLQPQHAQVFRNVLSEETRHKLRLKLDAMPSSDTWYGDIYKKAIYGPMVFRDETLGISKTVEALLPGYRVLADLYLEKTPHDRGFPFHTDFDSNGFMERPEDMITLWIPLTSVTQPGSGQLSIVNEEGAIRLSMIRVATQLHGLVQMMDPRRIPPHESFSATRQELAYLEASKFTPSLEAGDGLVFCNAFFHKSEPVVAGTPGLEDKGTKRAAYILRCVPKDCQFNQTRLLALQSLGQNLTVVNELLETYFSDPDNTSTKVHKSEIHRSAF